MIVAGQQLPKICDAGSNYFSKLDACIPIVIASKSEFLESFQISKVCFGAMVQSLRDLESLRYCSLILGTLEIIVDDATADFTALWDITEITGVAL